MEKSKEVFLEGIRGLAAVIVMLSHFVIVFFPAANYLNKKQIHLSSFEVSIGNSPLNLIYNGNFAVFLFFVLSGFVVSYKFFKTNNKDEVTSIAVRRYFRLMIPVIVTSTVVYLLMKANLFYNGEAAKLTGSAWLGKQWTFDPSLYQMLKITLFDVFVKGNNQFNNVLWTMKWEFLGSFILFGFMAVFGSFKFRWIIYIILLVIFFNSYYLAFIAGMMMADYINIRKPLFLKGLRINIFFMLSGLFLASYPTHYKGGTKIYDIVNKILDMDSEQIHIIGAILFIFSVLNLSFLQRFFSNHIFVYLGRISYSIYLIHSIFIGTISSYLIIKLNTHMSYAMSSLIIFLFSIVSILGLSALMNRYIDEPSNKFIKRTYNKLITNEILTGTKSMEKA
ncbi:acyltransferase family protein [Paenibacillus apis]|uniref:Acyltransferase n=1 Tax=Paenibacillus apis TaxID=1792174 RepID=A0A920CLV4_9BACL|nr:acyltransferase [Paenibacillus apis]GIO41968.1 acyltransferase [Paenibacillus apis]